MQNNSVMNERRYHYLFSVEIRFVFVDEHGNSLGTMQSYTGTHVMGLIKNLISNNVMSQAIQSVHNQMQEVFKQHRIAALALHVTNVSFLGHMTPEYFSGNGHEN